MIKINLMPKPQRKETLRRLDTRISAFSKMISFQRQMIIEAQRDVIQSLEALLRLHGVKL